MAISTVNINKFGGGVKKRECAYLGLILPFSLAVIFLTFRPDLDIFLLFECFRSIPR